MKNRLEIITTLENKLENIDKRIEVLESKINSGYINDRDSTLSWERDDELAHEEEELESLKIGRHKLEEELGKLKKLD